MPTDHHLLSIKPTYGPCNMVVNLQPLKFVTERDNGQTSWNGLNLA